MRKAGGFRVLNPLLLAVSFGALTLTIWLYVRYGFATLAGISSDSMAVHMDFDVFWHSARAWWEGGNPFRDTGGPDISNNPPFWTLLFLPLGLLDSLVAYRFWIPIAVLAQAGALAWMADELRLRAGWAVAGAGTLLVSAPLLGTLAIGQMYTILTLGLVAAWVWDRRGSPVASGCALGLVVAVKPSLAPVVLWPLVRRRWREFVAALTSGAIATLAGVLAVGFGPTLDWLKVLGNKFLDGSWDNASLPGAAALLFRENRFVEPLATLPWALTAAVVLGIGLVVLSAARVRRDPEMGLWVLAAASLLASPVTWHNYLPVLAPGVLLLMARGRVGPAMLLVTLGLIPQQWIALWEDRDTVVAALALALYFYVLLAHWISFLLVEKELAHSPTSKAAGVEQPLENQQ